MPINLSQLTNLKYLNLSNNNFDIYDIDFSNMTQLCDLHLAGIGTPEATELDDRIC